MTARRFATRALSTLIFAVPLLPVAPMSSFAPAAHADVSSPTAPSTSTGSPAPDHTPHLTTAQVRIPSVTTRLFRASAHTSSALVPASSALGRPSVTTATAVAPHATLRVTGTVRPRLRAEVTLQRRAGGARSFRTLHTVRTPGTAVRARRTFTFATTVPQGSHGVVLRIRVRTSSGSSYAVVGRFRQVASQDVLQVATTTPAVVETGTRSTPEPADAAARSLRVVWSTGVHPRVAILQHRPEGPAGGGAWVDVERSSRLPARSTGEWSPRTPAAPGMQYRAAFRYRTGISTTSSIATLTPVRLLFSDEFSGSTLDLDAWSERLEGNRCNFQAPGRSAVQVAGGTARLTPRLRADSEPAAACSGCVVPGSQGATERSQCVEVPHVMTRQRIPVPRPGTSVWIAARVKLQQGSDGEAHGGSHSAFWFNAGYCRGGEVDVFEYMGDHRLADADHPQSRGAVAYKHYDLSTCDGRGTMQKRSLTLLPAPAVAPRRAWSQQYTIFALRWTQTDTVAEYELHVDGTHVATNQGRPVTAPDAGGMVLSNFVSDYENRGAVSVKNSTLTVDWVRAWTM